MSVDLPENEPPTSPAALVQIALPSPQELSAYDQIVPGSAERMLTRHEEQLRHQQKLAQRSLTFAFTTAFSFMVISAAIVIVAILRYSTAGTIVGGALGTFDLAVIVSAFILVARRVNDS